MKITFNCSRCGCKLDKLHYVSGINDTMFLKGYCKIHGWVHTKKVKDLDIPTRLSKKAQAILNKKRQPKLF